MKGAVLCGDVAFRGARRAEDHQVDGRHHQDFGHVRVRVRPVAHRGISRFAERTPIGAALRHCRRGRQRGHLNQVRPRWSVTARSVCRLCCAQHDGAERIIALSRHASHAQLRLRAVSTSKAVSIDLQASSPTPSESCATPQITAPTSGAYLLVAVTARSSGPGAAGCDPPSEDAYRSRAAMKKCKVRTTAPDRIGVKLVQPRADSNS